MVPSICKCPCQSNSACFYLVKRSFVNLIYGPPPTLSETLIWVEKRHPIYFKSLTHLIHWQECSLYQDMFSNHQGEIFSTWIIPSSQGLTILHFPLKVWSFLPPRQQMRKSYTLSYHLFFLDYHMCHLCLFRSSQKQKPIFYSCCLISDLTAIPQQLKFT